MVSKHAGFLALLFLPGYANATLGGFWIDTGEHQTFNDELRSIDASTPTTVNNSTAPWNGTSAFAFGLKGQLVHLAIYAECSEGGADCTEQGIIVSSFTHAASGYSITSSSWSGKHGAFNYVNRPIRLFRMRALEIEGLSQIHYAQPDPLYDERHVPDHFRKPWVATSTGATGAGYGWVDRPGRDRKVYDIMYPINSGSTTTIAGGYNQAYMVEIFIPTSVPTGGADFRDLLGHITLMEGTTAAYVIPLTLRVFNSQFPYLSRPDAMMVVEPGQVDRRFLGAEHNIGAGSAEMSSYTLTMDRATQLGHMYGVDVLGDAPNTHPPGNGNTTPSYNWWGALTGELMKDTSGYAGPAYGQGLKMFCYSVYRTTANTSGLAIQARTQTMVTWDSTATVRDARIADVDFCYYSVDESSNYTFLVWFSTNIQAITPNNEVLGFATMNISSAQASAIIAGSTITVMDIVSMTFSLGLSTSHAKAATAILDSASPRQSFGLYNGYSPACGTMAIEDVNVAMRANMWCNYKVGATHSFMWDAVYYQNYQFSGTGCGDTNIWTTAQTYGGCSYTFDVNKGSDSTNSYGNGDGVLIYPGTDVKYPAENLSMQGFFPSRRLVEWGRGIDDYALLAKAATLGYNSQGAVQRRLQVVLWELGVESESDPTYKYTDRRWDRGWQGYENERYELSQFLADNDPHDSSGEAPLETPTIRLRVP